MLSFEQLETITAEASKKLEADPAEIGFFAWTEVFGTTAGPHGGIGGAMMTEFQVFGFIGPKGEGILWCAGRWGVWKNTDEKSWHRRLRKN